MIFIYFVAPEAAAELELLFNRPSSEAQPGLLTKGSCLAPSLGVTKVIANNTAKLFSLCSAT